MQRADTQTISIDAPRDVVLDLVADPPELPSWEGELRIRVRVSREHGTADFLAAGLPAGVEIGAFSRVVPNGRGCDYSFTQFLPGDMPDAEVDVRRAVVTDELDAVRRICTA